MLVVACASPKSVAEEIVKVMAKPPKKVNPEDDSLSASKFKAKNQPIQDSKSTAKNSSSSSNGTTDTIKSTDVAVLTSTDGKSEDTKKLLDSGDKVHDIKSSSQQQARKDVPKNKPNSQNHGKLSKSDDKLGTPVDPQ